MRNLVVNFLVNSLIESGSIEKEEKELYVFGVNQALLFLVNIVTTLGIGILFDMLWQSLLFTVAYIPLRRYAGGYHAKTPQICYCFSILLTICVLLSIKYILWENIQIAVVLFISFMVIMKKAPVASENKPLELYEKKLYKIRARLILLVEIVVALLAKLFLAEVTICIVVAISCAAIMLLLPTRGK
ncbi:accessory gene regulator B family protein [Anaerovorax odorimutans]|uniref:Accessory gene regulator B family protein n=1 Tax=Anaerovorax odorimutans TaxID=109327 RepID=A0ABT1RTS3_9FIRM|nr:accessory gene regulator B family protein [Anaerovorax odorimutans]MCQ4638514.1 accessory gene regulator B family protein [Anaerovorax odorimutans]